MCQEFSRLRAEEDERRGDVHTNAARCGYISFRGVGLRRPQRISNALAKLHGVWCHPGHPSHERLARMLLLDGASPEIVAGGENLVHTICELHGVLCHPSDERLARMLLLDGASQEIVADAQNLACLICARLSAPGAAPQASARKLQRFNEECLLDTVYAWPRDGSKWAVTHILCGSCTQRGGDVTKDASSQHSADVLNDRWVAVFGPTQRVQVDAGTEFRVHFERLCRMLDIMIVVIPPGNEARPV